MARVALSIENGNLRVLEVRGGRVRRWETHPLDPEAVKDGFVVSPNLLQGPLAALSTGRNRIKSPLSVAFPGTRSVFRTVTLPRVQRKILAEALRREAQRELPVDAEQIHLFWQLCGATREQVEFLLVGVQRDAYDRLYAAVRGARIRPESWELKPLALVRAVGRSEVVILDVDRENTDLIVVARGVPRLVRSLAEPPELTMEQLAQRLAEHLTQTITFYGTTQPAQPWDAQTPVVLTGPLAEHPQLLESLRASSPFPIQPFLSPLPAPSDFLPSSYATAIGLALKKGRTRADRSGRRPIDFNVLPEPYLPRHFPVKQAAVGVSLAALVGLLVLMVNVRAQASDKLSQKQTELAGLRRQLVEVNATLGKASELKKQTAETQALTQALEQERDSILATGGQVTKDLRVSLEAAPAGVSIARFSSSKGSISLEGEGSDYATVLEYSRALERSGRFRSVAIASLGQRSAGSAGGSVATFSFIATR